MAKPTTPEYLGVDVAKAELAIMSSRRSQLETIPNERRAIRKWIGSLAAGSVVAIEATNTFHLPFVEEAQRRGHTVYLIDGFRLSRYRHGVGGRAKTDLTDAALLLRYVRHEEAELRPWTPPPAAYAQVHRLLRRRARLVEARQKIAQSLKDMPELKQATGALLARIDALIRGMEAVMRKAVRKVDWLPDIRRCQGIEGIGELTAMALVKAFRRAPFATADAYIAYLGLDVTVRDSGTMRGQRKLSKQGDSEVRRLLHNAAMAASRSATWRGFYERCLARGMKPTQALVALARKLARVAFALLRDGSTYEPKAA